jgi:hypothetical protein
VSQHGLAEKPAVSVMRLFCCCLGPPCCLNAFVQPHWHPVLCHYPPTSQLVLLQPSRSWLVHSDLCALLLSQAQGVGWRTSHLVLPAADDCELGLKWYLLPSPRIKCNEIV